MWHLRAGSESEHSFAGVTLGLGTVTGRGKVLHAGGGRPEASMLAGDRSIRPVPPWREWSTTGTNEADTLWSAYTPASSGVECVWVRGSKGSRVGTGRGREKG